MPYTSEKPRLTPTSDELRARIPGWGVDLDPRDRPAVPKEKRVTPAENGAHWDFPERQEERWPRERTPEHKFLTPVFGTACPPRGLSGAIRRRAYQYSEAQTTHWMLLMAADRVDVIESSVEAVLRGRPDNPISETGIKGEITGHGIRSRVGQHRADVKHQLLDPVIVAAPWLALGGAMLLLARSARNRRERHALAG